MDNLLKINIHDVTQQFLRELGQKLTGTTEVEIRIPEKKKKEMFSDSQFWQIIPR